MIDIRDLFEEYHSSYIDFEELNNKLNDRPDLCAMILLDSLLPGNRHLISDADHDIIYFCVDVDELSLVATEDDVLMLVACGVQCDDEGLFMYV